MIGRPPPLLVIASPPTPAALVALVGAAFWGGTRLKPRSIYSPSPVLQFTLASPLGTIFAPPISRQAFAISPDGRRLAFTANGSDGARIWIRDLASLTMQPVAG